LEIVQTFQNKNLDLRYHAEAAISYISMFFLLYLLIGAAFLSNSFLQKSGIINKKSLVCPGFSLLSVFQSSYVQ